MTNLYQKYLEKVRADFERNTANHELTVLMDRSTDPVDPQPYRHLRIAAPGARMYSWDIICWPGHLATAGDIADGYTFARVHDMVDFFTPQPEPYRINPGYWAEKLAHSQRANAQVFNSDMLLESLDDYITEAAEHGSLIEWAAEDISRLRDSLRYDFPMETTGSEESAYQFLDQWSFTATDDAQLLSGSSYSASQKTFSFTETDISELLETARVPDYHLLLAMYAITAGLELYRAQRD